MRTCLRAQSVLSFSILAAASIVLVSCSGNWFKPSSSESEPSRRPSSTGPASTVPTSPPNEAPSPLSPDQQLSNEETLAPARAACSFGAGATPAATIGREYPIGDAIPIKHILILMQENRSFDHYFGRLTAQGYYKSGDFSVHADGTKGSGFQHSDEVDTPPQGWSNPDGKGGVVRPHLDLQTCTPGNHSWDDMHDQYNGGLLDRFVINNQPVGEAAFSYQDDTVIPFYYALANTFSISDRHFSSVMSSTWPNRFFTMAGTSFGVADNSYCSAADTAEHPAPHIFWSLEAAGRTWKDYTDGPAQQQMFPYFGILRRETRFHFHTVRCELFADLRNNTLPDVGFIMGNQVDQTSDESPTSLPGVGALWVEEIVRALFESPAWKDTALFITYDESGGRADHVPPVAICPPDSHPPRDERGNLKKGAFDRTGFRVPFTLVSPYARPHFVSHIDRDHTALTRFIEARFGLPALTARDANQIPPFDMFDFEHPAFMTPPKIAAHTTVDPAAMARCGNAKLAPTTCDH